ncbi:MAG: hypothetical protein WCK65_13330 [Rhodospirillaceae bacterium]
MTGHTRFNQPHYSPVRNREFGKWDMLEGELRSRATKFPDSGANDSSAYNSEAAYTGRLAELCFLGGPLGNVALLVANRWS